MDIAFTGTRTVRNVRGASAVALPGLVAVLGVSTLLQGAYWWPQTRLVLILASVVAVATGARVREGRAIVAGCSLGAGLLVSALVNRWPSTTARPFAILAIAALAYAITARAVRADGRVAVLASIGATGALAASIGIAGVALHLPAFAIRADTWRLSSTLSYQNAAGGLLMLALFASLGVIADRSTPLRRAMVALNAAGLVATLSRGALLGATIGAIVLAISRRVRARDLAHPFAGAVMIVAALAPATMGIGSGPVIVAAVALGVGISMAQVSEQAARRMGQTALTGLVVLCIAGASVPQMRARFAPTTTDRTRVWRESAAQIPDHIAFGTGPGTYRLVAPINGIAAITRHAHNEYLEATSETGLVGLASIVLACMALAGAAWRARSRAAASWWPCIAGLVAFMVHSGLDFIWHIPAIVAMAFALLAVACVDEEAR